MVKPHPQSTYAGDGSLEQRGTACCHTAGHSIRCVPYTYPIPYHERQLPVKHWPRAHRTAVIVTTTPNPAWRGTATWSAARYSVFDLIPKVCPHCIHPKCAHPVSCGNSASHSAEFCAVVAAVAETAFTLTEVKAGTPGRPSILAVGGLSAATLGVRADPFHPSFERQLCSFHNI